MRIRLGFPLIDLTQTPPEEIEDENQVWKISAPAGFPCVHSVDDPAELLGSKSPVHLPTEAKLPGLQTEGFGENFPVGDVVGCLVSVQVGSVDPSLDHVLDPEIDGVEHLCDGFHLKPCGTEPLLTLRGEPRSRKSPRLHLGVEREQDSQVLPGLTNHQAVGNTTKLPANTIFWCAFCCC